VMRNAGAFDAATRTMIVEMHVPNAGGPLLPGMYAQARLSLVNGEPNLQVPINALMVGGEGTRVATVDTSGVIQIRPVKIGRDLGKEVEIIAGLTENERVVNNPRDSLANGVKVRATEMQAHGDKKDAPKAVPAPSTDKPKT